MSIFFINTLNQLKKLDALLNFILNHIRIIELIVFWYPIIMGMLWTVGGIIYYFSIERKDPLPLNKTPFVSVLVPAFNEADNLEEVVTRLNDLDYPEYEIIVVNDGSTDETAEIASKLTKKYERVRFVNLKENSGKANALYLGFMAAKGEFLVCVDGDSYLDKDCLRYMIPHFTNPNNGERVGAVTGNPRVRNRSSLLAKIQICEYASIISLIKRTQRIWGKVMTVSGVVVAFRKQALLDCGLWDRDLITEDIGVTWKLEKNFWDIRYEPKAICWMLVPETIKGLYAQRKRWAQGGQEVMFRHAGIFKSWRRRRMYPIFFEQVMSLLWVLLWLLLTITEIFKLCYGVGSYMPYLWRSQFLSVICMVQFVVALSLEKKYDKDIFKYMVSAAWYPVVYWFISGIVALAALPSTIASSGKKLATWKSPDRGINTSAKTESQTQIIGEDFISENDFSDASVSSNPSTELTNTKKKDEDIIVKKQKWWKKIIEVLITAVCWAFILIYLCYLIYGLITVAMGKAPFEIWIYNRPMLQETVYLLHITAIVILVEIAVLLIWKEYNTIRFGKKNRRHFRPDVTVPQISKFLGRSIQEINAMQNSKIVTLKENIIPKDFKAENKHFPTDSQKHKSH